MAPIVNICPEGHDKSVLGRTKHGHCAECVRVKVREYQRKKRGTPLDAPVRKWTRRITTPFDDALKLTEFVMEHQEIAKTLLVIAKTLVKKSEGVN